jgi:hypothetical protein
MIEMKHRRLSERLIMNAKTKKSSTTLYFGLPVEVVHRMETCSLIRFSGQDTIVDTCSTNPARIISRTTFTRAVVPGAGFISVRQGCDSAVTLGARGLHG